MRLAPFRSNLSRILGSFERLTRKLEAHVEMLTAEVSEHEIEAQILRQQAAEKREEISKAARIRDRVREFLA